MHAYKEREGKQEKPLHRVLQPVSENVPKAPVDRKRPAAFRQAPEPPRKGRIEEQYPENKAVKAPNRQPTTKSLRPTTTRTPLAAKTRGPAFGSSCEKPTTKVTLPGRPNGVSLRPTLPPSGSAQTWARTSHQPKATTALPTSPVSPPALAKSTPSAAQQLCTPPSGSQPRHVRRSLTGMDKLQAEYDLLQAKLKQLKDDDRGRRSSGVRLSDAQPLNCVTNTKTAARQADVFLAPSTSTALRSSPTKYAAATPMETQPPLPHPPITQLPPAFTASSASLALAAADLEEVTAPLKLRGKYEAGRFEVADLAVELFEDPELAQLFEQGLAARLQSSKEGATNQSRILELAGLVKLLRRALRELCSRVVTYTDACARKEKDWGQQVQSAMLASDISAKGQQAELAQARRQLAQLEAAHKAEEVGWAAELERHKFQASELQRQLTRVAEERDRARADADHASSARAQLEQELKETQRSSSAQLRQAHVGQEEATRMVADMQGAAERRITSLQEERRVLSQRLAQREEECTVVNAELHALRQAHSDLQQSFTGSRTTETAMAHTLMEMRGQLAAERARLAAAAAGAAAAQQQLDAASGAAQGLQAELALRVSELAAAQERLRAAAEERVREETCAAAALAEAKEYSAGLAASLAATQAEAKALSASLEQQRAELARCAAQRDALSTDKKQLEAEAGAREERVALLDQQLAASLAAEARARDELAQLREDARVRDARLAQLEGEFAVLREVMGGDTEHAAVVSALVLRVGALTAAAAEAEATRRKLHNQLVELRGNVRVYCRLRPHPQPAVRCLPGGSSVALTAEGRDHVFNFDQVFGADSSQASVFASVSELVQSALDGYHVCLFSYGQTGAGKTFTMMGSDTPQQQGIIPRTVKQVLDAARKLEEHEWRYELVLSYVEVYNAALRDLLSDSPAASTITDPHAIKHDPSGGHTIINGVRRVVVSDAESAAALVQRAAAARASGSTAMNAESSRSHAVLALHITGSHPPTGTHLNGALSLVDLAGSERLDRSHAREQRAKEACAINSSLSSLGDVFAALAAKSAHVPYRNSKLTYLLQPCLGGSGKTLMFVNVNPEPASAHESLCSLRFAAKVNGCSTTAAGGPRRHVTTLAHQAAASDKAEASSPRPAPRLPGPPTGQRRMSMAPMHASPAKRASSASGSSTSRGPKRSKVG